MSTAKTQKVDCQCGSKILPANMVEHERTMKHLKYLKSQGLSVEIPSKKKKVRIESEDESEDESENESLSDVNDKSELLAEKTDWNNTPMALKALFRMLLIIREDIDEVFELLEGEEEEEH